MERARGGVHGDRRRKEKERGKVGKASLEREVDERSTGTCAVSKRRHRKARIQEAQYIVCSSSVNTGSIMMAHVFVCLTNIGSNIHLLAEGLEPRSKFVLFWHRLRPFVLGHKAFTSTMCSAGGVCRSSCHRTPRRVPLPSCWLAWARPRDQIATGRLGPSCPGPCSAEMRIFAENRVSVVFVSGSLG